MCIHLFREDNSIRFCPAAAHGPSNEFCATRQDETSEQRSHPSCQVIALILELALGFLWFASVFTLQSTALLPLLSSLLLATYGLAIAVNLARGRTHIDCGCSFASNRADSTSNQQLSVGLVARNILLASVALVPLLEPASRDLILIDHVLLVLTAIVLVLFFAAFNQLLANRGAIASWRNTHG